MKQNDKIKLRTWINKGWVENENDINNMHKDLFKHIDKEYDNIDTKKTHVIALVNILRNLKNDSIADKYSEVAIQLQNESSENKKNNKQLTESRIINPIDYEKISSLYNKLREKFDKGSISDSDHMLLVILALNTLMPPIRSEYTNMPIVTPDSKTDTGNLMVKAGKKKPWYIILNDFKTVKSFGKQKLEIPNKLKNFLSESLKKMPRSYLVSKVDNPNEPIGYPIFLRMVQKSLGGGTGSDVFRSSYITEFMKQRPTMSEREELAKKMLHSLESQGLHYVKVDEDKPKAKLLDPTNIKSVNEEKGGSLDIEKLKKDRAQVLLERNEKRKEYRREYYNKNKQMLQEKQRDLFDVKKNDINRRRIIQKIEESKLTGIPYNPKIETLQKYNIKLEDL